MSDRFRTIALVLRPFISDVYDLLAAADAVVDKDATVERPVITSPDGEATYNWATSRWDWIHDALVHRALRSYPIMESLDATRKIEAIKTLRAETKCGLKEAKDAIEDQRVVMAVANRKRDPWTITTHDDEPPF